MNTQEIAPLLRGLSFDGEKGDIVVYRETLENAELNCSVADLSDRYLKGLRSVMVEGVGGFLLGEDYDDAINGTSHAQKVTGRAGVVNNKVCVVTGGAQGFGEGIVRELIKDGAIVFIADMNVDGAKALAQELNQQEGRTVAFGISVNVTDEESVKSMVEEIVGTVGGIDVFISNAGVLKAGSVKEMTLKDFAFVTDVNYIGFFLCTKLVAPVMELMNQSTGKYFTDIVSICSKSALEGSSKNGAYAGSKFGSVGLVQSYAKELVVDNTKVNAICPGAVTAAFKDLQELAPDMAERLNKQVPMGYMGDPARDIAGVAFFLASEDARYMTGNALYADGRGHINGINWASVVE